MACICVFNSRSGHGEELLGYWKQLDHSLNVMAAQYYTALRAIEEQQEGRMEGRKNGMDRKK